MELTELLVCFVFFFLVFLRDLRVCVVNGHVGPKGSAPFCYSFLSFPVRFADYRSSSHG